MVSRKSRPPTKTRKQLNKYTMENEVTFEEAVKPLMKWLCKNVHPHTTVIVTGTTAEIVVGVNTLKTDEFLID